MGVVLLDSTMFIDSDTLMCNLDDIVIAFKVYK